MWPLRTIFYFCFFWVGCVIAVVNPIWGVVNYLIAYQTHPPSTWWGKPLVDLGFRFSMLAIGFTIVGLFFGRKHVPRTNPAISLWEVGVVALVLIGALNILLGVGYDDSAQFAFEKFWKLQVFVLILARLASTRKNLLMVIWTIVGGSLYLGWEAFNAPLWRFTLGRLDAFGGSDISTSSGASAHLAAMLPLSVVAFMIAHHWKWKLFAALSAVFSFNALILCRTRSAFIGLIAGVVVAALMAPQMRRVRVYVLLLIGAAVGYQLTDVHYWERMATMTDKTVMDADPAVVARADVWAASLQMLNDYPTGVGLGNFANVIGQYDARYVRRSPHNTIISCFCELGVVGGTIFMAMVIGSLYLLFRSSRLAHLTDQPLETKLLAYGMLMSLVVYFVAALGTERFSCESFWWVLVFPLCLYRVVTREAYGFAEAPALDPLVEPVDVGVPVRPWPQGT
jgi:putative inorganic carbon (hco3(-)) transporter